MTSRFINLFRRGGYVGAVVAGEESDTTEKTREERERFSVSAIAFCLEHDRIFRKHFLDKFLGILGQRNPRECSVQLEPCRQQDLLLEFDDVVTVVEFKLGARLAPHQRWDRSKFWKSGYGNDLAIKYPDKKGRFYFVVGYDLPARTESGIRCKTIKWENLLPSGRPETRMEWDLYDCIAKFGIPAFYTRHMKISRLEKAVTTAVKCVPHLRTACAEAGLRSDGRPDINEDHFGVYVKASPPKEQPNGTHAQLAVLRRKGDRNLAWLGYERSENDGLIPVVYLYCSNRFASGVQQGLTS